MAIPENIEQLANDIRTKIYGREVREALASGIEAAGSIANDADVRSKETETKQKSLEKKYDEQIANMSLENPSVAEVVDARVSGYDGQNFDTIGKRMDKVDAQLARTSNEIVEARGGETVLKNRLDKVDQKYQDVTTQLAETSKKLKDKISILEYEELKIVTATGYDYSPCFQAAVDNVEEFGTVLLPKGEFECRSNITINKTITIQGMGRDDTTCLVYSTTGTGFINFLAQKCKLYDVGFYYPEQVRTNAELTANNGSPKAYPPTLYGNGYYAIIERVNLGNAYIGMDFGVEDGLGTVLHSASSITLKDIIGTPLYRGLKLDACRDVPKITDIHFNRNIYAGTSKEFESNVYGWIKNYAYAFWFGRVDFGTILRAFAYGYNRGVVMQSLVSTGSSDRLYFESCQFDKCVYPLWLQNFQATVYFDKCTFVGDGTGYINIYNTGTEKDLVVFSECLFDSYDNQAILTKANTNFNNCSFTNWGKAGGVYDAIRNPEIGKTVIIDSCMFDGSGGANCRGFFNDDVDNFFIVKNSTFKNMINQGAYRVTTGKVIDENNKFENVVNARNQISFITEAHVYKGDKAPTTGTYKRGDIVLNNAPTAGNVFGWECIAGGSPGMWVPLGQVGNKTTGSSPIGSVTPFFVGEEILDTTNKIWYKATGLTSSDWVALN